LQFEGEMAGIEYAGSNAISWFGRQITLLKDKNITLLEANKNVSVHTSVEQNLITLHFSLKQNTQIKLYVSTLPKAIKGGSHNIKFTHNNGIITFNLEKAKSCILNITL